MEGPAASTGSTPLAGGQLLAAISNRIVAILREHYGRGPMKAKTYALDDLIVVVMRGSGFTPLEKTIMDSGEPDRVVDMRHDFQRLMTKRFTETIQELTGRNVVAFLSQAHVDPDLTPNKAADRIAGAASAFQRVRVVVEAKMRFAGYEITLSEEGDADPESGVLAIKPRRPKSGSGSDTAEPPM